VDFTPISPEAMRAARLLTGSAMALWIATSFVPPLRPYAAQIRSAVLAAYLLGIAACLFYAFAID
jgi:hypothetical protein